MVSNYFAPNDCKSTSSCSSGSGWRSLDPLNTSDVSISIHQAFDTGLCGLSTHTDNCCQYRTLRRLYGPCLFKCPHLGCTFRRQGFETRKLQSSHTKHHDRPWKCGVPGCEYAETGFLSKPMRDAHLDQFHTEDQQRQSVHMPDTQTLDKDEIEALFFDLVRADRTTEVKQLLGHFEAMSQDLREEVGRIVSKVGSDVMMDVLYKARATSEPKTDFERDYWLIYLDDAIRSKNLNVVQWILRNTHRKSERATMHYHWAITVGLVLESDSEEVFQCLLQTFVEEFTIPQANNKLSPTTRALGVQVVRAAARRPDRERRLVILWDKLRGDFLTNNLNQCLRYVAETCYSIPLAKALLCYGADINSTKSEGRTTVTPDGESGYRTALHRALRRSSPEAAEMARFLLYRGANPETTSTRSKHQSIRDEIGTKEISKWLGMSWDELVAKVKADRDAGICPEEFM